MQPVSFEVTHDPYYDNLMFPILPRFYPVKSFCRNCV